METVDGRKLWSAMHFVFPEPGRPLHGVYVEPRSGDGALLVASDGVCMVVLHDPAAAVSAPAVLHLDKDAMKRLRQGSLFSWTEEGQGLIDTGGHKKGTPGTSYNCNGSVLLDVTYPNWRKALPKPGMKLVTGDFLVDFEQLAAFRYLWSTPTKTNVRRAIRIAVTTPVEPILLRSSDDDRFGVIMPVTAEQHPAGLPAFIWPQTQTDFGDEKSAERMASRFMTSPFSEKGINTDG